MSCTIFIINAYVYVNNGVMINISNKMEKEYIQNIVTDIKNYENDNGIKVNKICIYYDQYAQKTFCNFPNNSFTIKSLYTSYSKYHIIDYYLGYNLEVVEGNKEYQRYFKTKNWDEYSNEQLIFDNDTLHLCVY